MGASSEQEKSGEMSDYTKREIDEIEMVAWILHMSLGQSYA
jgi:hypothetical protein